MTGFNSFLANHPLEMNDARTQDESTTISTASRASGRVDRARYDVRGLLGDAAGFLSVAMRAAKTEDHAVVIELVKVLSTFRLVFGIPLSFGALLSGLTLGLGTRWAYFATRESPPNSS